MRRTLLALAVLGVVGLVPRAAADPSNPLDTDAPGSVDPIPADASTENCTFSYTGAPAGFTPPAGLPAKTLCVAVKTGTTVTFPPITQATGVGTLGLQGAPRLAQWVKIPAAVSAAVVPIHQINYTTAPDGEPANTVNVIDFYPRVWFLSQDGRRVGEMPPFRVRTLAFGVVPVEVTVHLTQPRLADGSVEPIKVTQKSAVAKAPDYYPGGRRQIFRDASGSGRVDLRLSDLKVDGQPVDVGSGCSTRTPGRVSVFGRGYYGFVQAQPQPSGTYNGQSGGLLTGTIDIPSFAGCRGSSGDDVSAILTNAVSGDGNPISVFQTQSSANCFPRNLEPCRSNLKPLTVPTTRPATR